jgi:hypothetical protein
VNSLRFRWLALVGLVAGFTGWLVNWLATRNGYGKRDRPLDPILATRTLVLAQACAYAGALSLGWHAGIFVDQLTLLSVRSTTAPLWGSVALMVGGTLMIMVGLVVEDFCKLPPDDDGTGAPGHSEGEYA